MGQFSEEETQNYKSRSDFLLVHGHRAILFLVVQGDERSAKILSWEANAQWKRLFAITQQPQPRESEDFRQSLLQEVRNLSPGHRTKHHFALPVKKQDSVQKLQFSLFLLDETQRQGQWLRHLALRIDQSTSEEKYTVLAGHLHDALRDTNILAVSVDEQGNITFANRAMQEALEENETELLGRNFFEEFRPLKGNKLSMEAFLAMAAQQDFRVNLKRSVHTKSGKLIKLHLRSIVYHGVEGSAHGLTILAENITEQNELKRHLKTQNRQLAELFKNAHDLIQIFTDEGDILFVNQSWKEKLGYLDRQQVDLNFYDIIHPNYLHETLVYLDKLKRGLESSSKFQTVLMNRSGQKVYVAGSVSARSAGSQGVEFRGIFHDISDQVRAERAQQLYNSIANLAIHSPDLDTLFAGMHRELKKVLTADNIYVCLLGEDERLHFPYQRRSVRQQLADPHMHAERTLAEFVLNNQEAVLFRKGELKRMVADGTIAPFDHFPAIWLGIPLLTKDRAIGLLSVQHYETAGAITKPDLELLDFVSGQLALAVERKVNEEKLSEQTARLNAIFESSTHLIWSVDLDYHFTTFNKNFLREVEKKYGIRPMLGQLFHDDASKASKAYFRDWRKSYELAASGFPSAFEMQFDSEVDSDNWYQVFVNPVYRYDGSIREISGIAHDITVRKKSELKLLESEEKFRNIFESFQDIYFRCSLDGTITLISPSVKELTDYETYDVVGKNITNYYLYDSRTKNLIRQLVKNKRVRNFEASVIKANGDLMQCICNVRLIYNLNRRPVEIEGTIRDITKLKKTTEDLKRAKELAENSLKVKEGFLANMSHEIRTPMNGIISMIDLLSDTSLNAEQTDYVETIRKSSETLLNILNDILDLSKIEAGKMKLHPVVVSLSAVLEKEHALFFQQARQKNIDFTYTLDQGLPEFVKLDETRFLQVLSNLCSNALKFTPQGGKVRIRVTDISDQNKHKTRNNSRLLKVEVKDNGIGISEEAMASLFQNFSQVDSSITKKYGGTGLGLSISKQLSEMMGGTIGVESKEGAGSTFWFTCQIREAEQPERKQSIETNASSFLSERQPLVLLVDDNQVNRKVTTQILKKNQCRVEAAVSGAEAITKVQEKAYDLILMDIQMPEMDGVATTQAIRDLGLAKVPPIIAMTAYSMQGDREKFVEAGLDDYLSKPIRPQALIDKLAAILQQGQSSVVPDAANQGGASGLVIDFAVLSELEKYGGKELIVESLEDFRQEADELINSCAESFKIKDYDDILAKLHTLKGNASTLGIQRLAGLVKDTEAKLKADQRSDLQTQLISIRAAFAEFEQAFKHFQNTTKYG